MGSLNRLHEIRAEVSARCDSIAAEHGAWPCRAGCDQCCRHLAREMELTMPEWAEVERGLAALPEARQREVAARVEESGATPRVCPFLSPEAGMCEIYEHRPVACRTYGYYVDRDGGRYCQIIGERVQSGEFSNVIWGNHDAVEARVISGQRLVGLREWRGLTGLLFFKRS